MPTRARGGGGYFNGEVIRALRESRGLSLERLADSIGTTKANISKWENARVQKAISYPLFLALASALYIAPEELARRLVAPPVSNPANASVTRPRRS